MSEVCQPSVSRSRDSFEVGGVTTTFVEGADEDEQSCCQCNETETDFDGFGEIVTDCVEEGGVEIGTEVDGLLCWHGELFDGDGGVGQRRVNLCAELIHRSADEGVERAFELVESWDRVVEGGQAVEDA